MEGQLLMGAEDRRRLLVIERVCSGDLTMAEAAACLSLSYRQVQRLMRRYRDGQAEGILHCGRGRPSNNRCDPELKRRVVECYREHFKDFGPTLASEEMADRHGLEVVPETLRLWLIEAELWTARRRRGAHRTWRERKARFGELVQMDGSHHAWFEKRAPACCLMSLVDDATSTVGLLLAPQETTLAAMQVMEKWVLKYGVPVALYLDRKNVYLTGRQPTIEEQLAGKAPATQFGRACADLGIRLTTAYSPQAKGRVERKHGVCQDRLVKLMRLEDIRDIEQGNRFLECFTQKLNARFAVAARDTVNLHRPLDADVCLRSVFSFQEQRTVNNDLTVRFQQRWLQIEAGRAGPLPRTRVTVELWQDGSLHVRSGRQELKCRELPDRPARALEAPAARQPAPRQAPSQDHPWRKPRTGQAELWRLSHDIEEMADYYLGRPSVGGIEVSALMPEE